MAYVRPASKADVARLTALANSIENSSRILRNEKYEQQQNDDSFGYIQDRVFGEKYNPLTQAVNAGNSAVTGLLNKGLFRTDDNGNLPIDEAGNTVYEPLFDTKTTALIQAITITAQSAQQSN